MRVHGRALFGRFQQSNSPAVPARRHRERGTVLRPAGARAPGKGGKPHRANEGFGHHRAQQRDEGGECRLAALLRRVSARRAEPAPATYSSRSLRASVLEPPVTWRVHGGCMAVTWRSHGASSSLRLRGGYMAVAWRLHGASSSLRLRGDYMAVAWWLHGGYMERPRASGRRLLPNLCPRAVPFSSAVDTRRLLRGSTRNRHVTAM